MRANAFLLSGWLLVIACVPAWAQDATRADKAAGSLLRELLKGQTAGGAAAVVPFKSPDGSISALGGLLAERLTALLAKSGKMTALDRRYLGRLLGELKLELSGLAEPYASAEMGKLTGARFLLLGELGALGKKNLVVNARLVETTTGKVAAAARAEIKLNDTLRALYARTSAADTEAEKFFETRAASRGSAPADKNFRVELLLSQYSFAAGQTARAVVSVSSAAEVYLYSVDAQGRAVRVFPLPGESGLVEAGRPLLFPGEEREKAGFALEAALAPGAEASVETLSAFAVMPGSARLEGAASYAEIISRLEASGTNWSEDSREFSIHR